MNFRLRIRGTSFLTQLLGVSALSACIPEFDEDSSLVETSRILAVRVEPAESEEKQNVTLTALVATPEGGSRLVPKWAFCSAPKPLTELGPVAQACVEQFSSQTPLLTFLGDGASIGATVPESACRVFGPIPPDAASGDASTRPVDPDETGGFYQPILAGASLHDRAPAFGRLRLSCGLTGLSPDEALKYRLGYRNNENPAIAALVATVEGTRTELVEGGSFAVEPGAEVSFEVSWSECPREASCGDGVCSPSEERVECPEDCSEPRGCSGAETFAVFDKQARELGFKREGISVAWYSDVGGFSVPENGVASNDPDTNRTTNTWTAPESERTAHVWVVVRDERGGVGFRSVSTTIASR
jgi:hypothetical protein